MSANGVWNIFWDFQYSVRRNSSVEDEIDEADEEEGGPQHHERQLDQLEDEQFPILEKQKTADPTFALSVEIRFISLLFCKKLTLTQLST